MMYWTISEGVTAVDEKAQPFVDPAPDKSRDDLIPPSETVEAGPGEDRSVVAL